MLRSVSRFSMAGLCMLTLAACTTTPDSSTLLTGISSAETAKPLPDGQLRLATDPVCQTFYANSKTFIEETNRPSAGSRFLTNVGLSVLASTATAAIPVNGISSRTGRVAARSAIASSVVQGSRLGISEVSKNSAPGVKIAKAAEELGCPISFTS